MNITNMTFSDFVERFEGTVGLLTITFNKGALEKFSVSQIGYDAASALATNLRLINKGDCGIVREMQSAAHNVHIITNEVKYGKNDELTIYAIMLTQI